MKKRILDILESAVRAPSGDNCQPWHFVINPPELEVHNLPEKDNSLYNFQQKASMLAHGALLENINILATTAGLETVTELFPDAKNPNFIARVNFQEATLTTDPLAKSIAARNTNRRLYDSQPLPVEARLALQQSANRIADAKVYLSNNEEEKQTLAALLCQNDRLVFENKYLHHFLFDHIRFTPDEVKQTRDGIDLRAFELPMMDRLAFGMLKSWKAVQIVNALGLLSKKVTKQAKKLCLSASAIGVVTINGDSDRDFVRGGQAMQRVWLEATHQGLQLHPMAGLGCLIYRISRGGTAELSEEHLQTIRGIETQLRQIFGCGEETLAMLFRVGYAAPPTEMSLRKPLTEVAEVKN